MIFKEAIIAAHIKANGLKPMCREEFCQKHPAGFKAIQAVFGTYAQFQIEVAATSKPVLQKARTK